jgi:hypothetical protein
MGLVRRASHGAWLAYTRTPIADAGGMEVSMCPRLHVVWILAALAGASSAALAQPALPVAPPEDAHDVPPEIADQIRQHNGDDTVSHMTDYDRAAHHKWSVEHRNQLYATYRGIAAKFEAAWSEFSARKTAVDKAVADADELSKAGKLDEARSLLDSVITPVDLDANGHLPRFNKDRAFIEARDAEVPALLARFQIARAQHDWNAAITAKVNVTVRHRIDQDQPTERLLWIAWDQKSGLVGYSSSDPKAWARLQVDAAQNAVDGGVKLADTLDLGAAHAMISTEAKLKKGDWVIIPYIDRPKISAKELSYKETIDWRVPTECHTTNRVSFIDDSGTFHYEEDCAYDYHSMVVTLTAALREPVPEWATKSPRGITIVGKIVTPGPHWKLTDALVIDNRYRD